jgi:hypothetical protein
MQQRYAVLIGVDTYEDKLAIPTLRYCAADCQLLQRALLRAGGFLPDQVLLMTQDSPHTELHPRRNNLIGQLKVWSQRPSEDSLFLVAFCGHAWELQGSVYLLPSDARAADLELTGLPFDVVKSILRTCPARNKVVFLDACHSGAGRNLVRMTPAFAEQLRAEGVTVLSACKTDEVAHECEEVGHGVFSYFLARGLEGQAADASGVVSCDSLYRYVHREVVSWAAQRGLSQTPWRLSEGVGQQILIGPAPSARRCASADGRLSMPRFHYGSVVPPEYYIDRERELREAQHILEAGQSFLLVGDRRSGKTSFCKKLIHHLMSRADNTILASYLNLQRCHKLEIESFLYETISDLIGEIARQVFHCKFTDLMRRNPADANPALRDDPLFEALLTIFRLVRKHLHSRGNTACHLETQDFVRLVQELQEILRARGWQSFVLFYDEANRLPGSFPVELLMSNVEALTQAGVISVYAASPDMSESFAPLQESFYEQVHLGPFAEVTDMRKLLARYYFGDVARLDELPLTPQALALLWEYTQGKPYLIQLVAGHSFRCALDQQAETVTETHVLAARELLRTQRPEVHL